MANHPNLVRTTEGPAVLDEPVAQLPHTSDFGGSESRSFERVHQLMRLTFRVVRHVPFLSGLMSPALPLNWGKRAYWSKYDTSYLYCQL